jgi:hypothetical protein
MYKGIRDKKAYGPNVTKTAPLKSNSGDLIDHGEQIVNWVKH